MANSTAVGVAYSDPALSGGTLDNTPVGASTASTGAFTTLSATGAVTLTGAVTASGGGSLTGTWTNLGTVTTVDINGGTADAVVIGGASAAAGTFTTLTATGATALQGNCDIGNAAADTIGFYGATKISQRAAACQATSTIGTASSADVTSDLKATIIELMDTMNALGLWKGSA